MTSSNTKPASNPLRKGLREIVLVLFITLALYLFMALFSYHPQDPGWSAYEAVTDPVHNLGGEVGAWFADVSLYLFGYIAFFMPLGALLLGWRAYRGKFGFENPEPMLIALRIIGGLLLILSAAGLASLHFVAHHFPPGASAGGIFGQLVGIGLVDAFNLVGSSILLLAAFFASITLFFGISWFNVADKLGAWLLSLFVQPSLEKPRHRQTIVSPAMAEESDEAYAEAVEQTPARKRPVIHGQTQPQARVHEPSNSDFNPQRSQIAAAESALTIAQTDSVITTLDELMNPRAERLTAAGKANRHEQGLDSLSWENDSLHGSEAHSKSWNHLDSAVDLQDEDLQTPQRHQHTAKANVDIPPEMGDSQGISMEEIRQITGLSTDTNELEQEAWRELDVAAEMQQAADAEKTTDNLQFSQSDYLDSTVYHEARDLAPGAFDTQSEQELQTMLSKARQAAGGEATVEELPPVITDTQGAEELEVMLAQARAASTAEMDHAAASAAESPIYSYAQNSQEEAAAEPEGNTHLALNTQEMAEVFSAFPSSQDPLADNDPEPATAASQQAEPPIAEAATATPTEAESRFAPETPPSRNLEKTPSKSLFSSSNGNETANANVPVRPQHLSSRPTASTNSADKGSQAGFAPNLNAQSIQALQAKAIQALENDAEKPTSPAIQAPVVPQPEPEPANMAQTTAVQALNEDVQQQSEAEIIERYSLSTSGQELDPQSFAAPPAPKQAPEPEALQRSGQGLEFVEVPKPKHDPADFHDKKQDLILPDLSQLDAPHVKQGRYTEDELVDLCRLVEDRLAEYGVIAEVEEVHPGPVITRFELRPAPGTKASKIVNLSTDLARSLLVSRVRVVEVIPGKSTIGLEIPNENREIITLSEILGSEVYQHAASPMTLALGQDISGEPVVANLAKMPHLLVAGTTGSGKSVGVNAMLMSLLFKARASDIRLLLIDPKMLELSVYEGIPHLLAPVVTDMNEASNGLRWNVAEMERRYKLMAAMGVRNIAGFNKKVQAAIDAGEPILDPLHDPQKNLSENEAPPYLRPLPYIVIVVDEFADLMMVVGKKVEELIARLAQKARAAGIHLILATQRPSVDVITGLIKANIPTRIGFQVSSKIDSRTILDQTGAETLLGHGDMLYLPPGTAHPLRVHGAFVDDHEVHNVVEFLKQQGEPDYVDEMLNDPVGSDAIPGLEPAGSSNDDMDPLYDQAVQIVTESRKASISYVQRRLKVGYNRAARMIEEMESAGVVSAVQSNGMREVIAPPPPPSPE